MPFLSTLSSWCLLVLCPSLLHALRHSVRLVFTGDIRGGIFPADQNNVQIVDDDFEACAVFGGAARREAYVALWRDMSASASQDLIVLDGGSYFFGSGTTYYAFNVNASATFMNRFGYDVASLRYLDLTEATSEAAASRWLNAVDVPFVLSNWNSTASRVQVAPWYLLRHETTGEIRAGVMGLIDDHLVIEERQHVLSRIKSLTAAREAMRREVAAAASCADETHRSTSFPIILLTDVSLDNGLREILEQVEGIDIALTSSYLDKQHADIEHHAGLVSTEFSNWFGDRVVVATLGGDAIQNRHIGTLTFEFDDERGVVESYDVEVVDLTCDIVADLTSVALDAYYDALSLMRSYWREMEELMSVPVAQLERPVRWDPQLCRHAWCEMGNVVADAYRFAVNDSDIALVNSGAMRASMDAGPVAFVDALAVAPFLSTIFVVELSGATIVEMLRHGLFRKSLDAEGFLHVSGLEYDIVSDGSDVKLIDVRLKGAKENVQFDLNETYLVVMNYYLASGGDEQQPIAKVSGTDTGIVSAEALAAFLATCEPELSSRISTRAAQHVAIGALCSDHDGTCDAVTRAVEMINDKQDGIFDDILLEDRIHAFPAVSSCGHAENAVAKITADTQAANVTPIAFVGPQCAADTALAISTLFVSPTARAAEIDAPLFARTTPSHADVVQALVNLFDLYNWAKVAVLAGTTSPASAEIADEFEAAFTSQPGTEVLYRGNFNASVQEHLNAIDANGGRIILVCGLDTEALQLFAAAAEDERMRSSGYAWILANGTTGFDTPDTTSFLEGADDSVRQVASGALTLSFDERSSISVSDTLNGRLAADAAFAIALALDHVHVSRDLLNGVSLRNALGQTSFDGATGAVAFDRRGNRAHVQFAIKNFVGGNSSGWVDVGVASGERFGPVLITGDILWPGGVGKPPDDDREETSLRICAMCAGDSADDAETCAHVRFAVDLINDKQNGWFDGTLEFARLQLSVNKTDCDADVNDTVRLARSLVEDDKCAAIVGPACPHDAVAVASAGLAVPMVSFSPNRRELAQSPNLLKVLPPDEQRIGAIVKILVYYGWLRVAVVHSNSTYFTGLADTFAESFERTFSSNLRSHMERFSFPESDDTAFEPLLKDLDTAGYTIAVLLTDARHAAPVFRAVATTGFMHGAGYAWLGIDDWTTPEVWQNDSTASTFDDNVLAGAFGALGVRPLSDTDASYAALWRQSAPSRYEDADGNRSTLAKFGTYAADAVFSIARGLDSVYRSLTIDLEALLVRMRSESFQGASGLVAFDADGNRQGTFQIVNLNYEATWIEVGTVTLAQLEMTSSPLWPGGTTDVPKDEIYGDGMPEAEEHGRPKKSFYPLIAALSAVIAVLLACAAFARFALDSVKGRRLQRESSHRFSKSLIMNAFFTYKVSTEDVNRTNRDNDAEAVRAILQRKQKWGPRRLWISSKQVRCSLPEKYVMAALYTTASIHGLPFQIITAKKQLQLILGLFRLRHGSTFRSFMCFMVFVHCALCFFEGPCRKVRAPPYWRYALAVEFACIAAYAFDLGLGIRLHQVQSVLRCAPAAQLVVVTVMLVDATQALVVAVDNGSRSSRPLRIARGFRPFMLLAYNWNFYALSRQVTRSLTDSLDTLLVGLCFLVLFALSLTSLFEADGHDHRWGGHDFHVSDARTNSRSFFTLARLVTVVNATTIVNSVHIYRRVLLLVSVIVFSLCVYCYLSVFLGELTQLHAKHRELHVLWILQQQALNLSAAFELIKENDLVTVDAWRKLMKAVDPLAPDYVIDIFFRVVDVDRSGTVSHCEFIDLGDVITSRLTQKKTEANNSVRRRTNTGDSRPSINDNEGAIVEYDKDSGAHEAGRAGIVTTETLAQFGASIKRPATNRCFMAVAVANIALQWGWPDAIEADSALAFLACLEATSHYCIKRATRSVESDNKKDMPNERDIDTVDFALTLSCSIGGIALLGVPGRYVFISDLLRHARLWRVLFVVQRCRFAVNDGYLRPFRVLRIIALLVPLFLWLLAGLGALLYFFAINGTESFCKRVAHCRRDRCVATISSNNEPNFNFEAPQYALVTLLFSFLAGGAGEVTDATFWLDEGDRPISVGQTPGVRFYWLIFIFGLDLVYANIAASIIIDAYELQAGRVRLAHGTYNDTTYIDAGNGRTLCLSAEMYSPVRRAIANEILRYHIAANEASVVDLKGLRLRALSSIDLACSFRQSVAAAHNISRSSVDSAVISATASSSFTRTSEAADIDEECKDDFFECDDLGGANAA